MMKKRNPILAAILGFFVYPLGYFYLGHFWRGIAVIFIVYLVTSPFIPADEFKFLENISGNLTNANASTGSVNGSSQLNLSQNQTIPSLFTEPLNQSQIFDQLTAPYMENPFLIFMQFFISSVVALDCYFLARKMNLEVEGKMGVEKKKPLVSKPSKKEGDSPTVGAIYGPGVEVKCPRCNVGLAMTSPKCPNCGVKLTHSYGKDDESAHPKKA